MAHVTRRLPAQRHLDILKREGRELLRQVRAGDNSASSLKKAAPEKGAAEITMKNPAWLKA